jgi:hypothetical protein
VSAGAPAKYEDDAARIEQAGYIPSSATTRGEIEAALASSGFPSSAIPEIASWLATQSDAWDVFDGGSTEPASQVASDLDRATNGVVSQERARSMGTEVERTVQQARSEAASRVSSNGQIRTANGGFGPKIQNAEEVVREDGIYYRATEGAENPGREYLGARFDK